MGVRLEYEVDNGPIEQRLRALRELGRDPREVLEGIAYAGEQSTRERFAAETDPEGKRWEPSIRKRAKGGKTLTASGLLAGSITSRVRRQSAQWGTNRVYAAIHQFGGKIRAKAAGALKFAIPGGGFAQVPSVDMPQRAFLGVNADDRRAFQDVVEVKLRAAGERGR